MSSRLLNRRAILKGALATGTALAVPIPILDARLNSNGDAFAQSGAPLPKRYCTWFFGNGVLPPLWVPKATGSGAAWELSEELAPLKNVKQSLTVVSGLRSMILTGMPHPQGSASATTGGTVIQSSHATAESIDQSVKRIMGAKNTVEVGVSDATPNGGTLTLKTVSHTASGAANYPDYVPSSVFSRLFSNVSTTPAANDANAAAAAEALKKLNAAKKSVLDMVMTDVQELSGLLGDADKKRMDQHLDGIRQLELQLTAPEAMGGLKCTKPGTPTLGKDSKSEAPKNVNNLMADLMTMAYACNSVQVGTFVFTLPAAHVYYRSLGADMNDDFHDTICHTDAGNSSGQTRVHRGVVYAMENLAYFLEKMQGLSEGAGSLLDGSLIYVTSDIAWGKTHDLKNWPVLLAGKAGGALKGDQHVSHEGENLSKVLFSIQQLVGGNPTSVGNDGGMVTSGLAGF